MIIGGSNVKFADYVNKRRLIAFLAVPAIACIVLLAHDRYADEESIPAPRYYPIESMVILDSGCEFATHKVVLHYVRDGIDRWYLMKKTLLEVAGIDCMAEVKGNLYPARCGKREEK